MTVYFKFGEGLGYVDREVEDGAEQIVVGGTSYDVVSEADVAKFNEAMDARRDAGRATARDRRFNELSLAGFSDEQITALTGLAKPSKSNNGKGEDQAV